MTPDDKLILVRALEAKYKRIRAELRLEHAMEMKSIRDHIAELELTQAREEYNHTLRKVKLLERSAIDRDADAWWEEIESHHKRIDSLQKKICNAHADANDSLTEYMSFVEASEAEERAKVAALKAELGLEPDPEEPEDLDAMEEELEKTDEGDERLAV